MLVTISQALAGLFILLAGGEALVRGSVGLARHWHLPPLIIGLTVVSIGTSAPELAVSLMASADGFTDIALGNVVGSNICNIGLILGLLAFIRPLRVERRLVVREAPILLAATALVVAFLFDNTINRLEGGVLLAGLLAYLTLGLRGGRRMDLNVGAMPGDRDADIPWRNLTLAVVGTAALALGGDWLVDGAVAIAEAAGVPRALIGVTLVAVGTSLPELVASLMALRSNEADLAIGNVMGSNLFNLLGILGISAVGYRVDMAGLNWADIAFLVVLTASLVPMVASARRLVRWEGTVLLAAYLGYLSWLVLR